MPKEKRPPSKTKPKSGSKGLLIKGISDPLPVEILDEPVFRKEIRTIIRGYAGIYVLYARGKIFYIGLATDLYQRLQTHRKTKPGWDSFRIFRVNRTRLLKDIETLLLRVVVPPGNKVSGNFKKDADITMAVRKAHRVQSRRYKMIGKRLANNK